MATQVGIAKQVLGSAVAVDALGNQRVINSGDPIFLGEVIKTLTDVSKVIVATNDGKDITILGKDSVKMDSSVVSSTSFGDGAVADADALQKAILSGADLTQLEETAAGGPAAGGGAGGTAQITPAYFAAGGHYANVTASTGNLADGIAAGAGGVSPVTGGLTDTGATTGGVVATPINPPAVVSIDGKDPSAPTNNAAPTIKVTVDSGTTPDLVDDNGNIIPTDKKDNGDGTWDITPKDPITDPDNVNVIATDPTTGEKSDPTPVNPNIDTEAPAVVVDSVTSIDSSNPADNTADTGNVKGSATDSGNPIIDGSKVEVFNSNGEKIGEGTTKDGKFDITTDKPINPNDTVKVVVTDPAGNPGEATGTAGDIVTTSPHAELEVSDIAYRGEIKLPFAREATIKNVKNIGADQKLKVTLLDQDGNEIPNVNWVKTGNSTDAWGRETLAEMAAVREYRLDLVDANGNVIQNLDKKQVSNPYVEIFNVTTEKDGVVSEIDGLTNDNTPTINGNVMSGSRLAGSVVAIFDGDTKIGTAVIQDGGAYSFTPTTPLTDGTHTLIVKLVGKDSDTSISDAPYTIDIDATKPTTPDIVANPDGSVSVTPKDDSTKTEVKYKDEDGNEHTFTAEKGDDGKWKPTSPDNGVKVDPDTGKITIPADKIEDGSEVTAKTEDKAGNVSDEGKVVAGSGIEFSPAITSVVDDVNANEKDSTGDVKGAKTNDNKPEIKGNIGVEKSGVEVTIYDNGTELGKATTNEKGEFSFTPSTALTDGKHEFVAKATDEKGEKSSPAVSVDIDTQVINDLVVNSITGDNTLNQVEVMFDQVVSGKISGEFKAGDKVEVTTVNGKTFSAVLDKNGKVIVNELDKDGNVITNEHVRDSRALSSVLDKDGNFAIKIPGTDLLGLQGSEKLPLTQDSINGLNVTVKVTTHDDAGNEKVVTKVHNFNYDFYDLEAPKITAIVDNAEGIVGNIANNGLTNDSTPTIKGTISDQVLNATKEVQIFDGDKLIGTATAVEKTDTNGKRYGEFEFTSPALKDGAHNISVKAVDASGNTSNASNTFTINVDTKVGVEVKPDGQIIITNAESGIKPTISIGGKDVSVVEKNGKFYIPTESLAKGKTSVEVSVTDKAGNVAKVTTEATSTKEIIEVPLDAKGAYGYIWTYGKGGYGGGYPDDLGSFLTKKSDQGLYLRSGEIHTGAGGAGNGDFTGNVSLLGGRSQVYAFSGYIGINKTIANNKTGGGYDLFIESSNSTSAKILMRIDGKQVALEGNIREDFWENGKAYQKIDLKDKFPNGLEKDTVHKYEVVIDLPAGDNNRIIKIGFYDENGNKVYLSNSSSEISFANDKINLDGYSYDSATGKFVKEGNTATTFKAVSSKTAHDIDGTDGVETINGTNDGDYIDAKGGADTINAGKGDDVVVFDTKDVKVDGAEGRDTLLVKESIDFTKIQNLDSKVENFELISLGEKAADSVSITLNNVNVADILDNQVVNGKPTNNVLEIIGDSNDKVTLKGFTEVTDSLKTGVNGFEQVTDNSGRTNNPAGGANVSAEPVGALNSQADKLSKLLDTETNRVFKTTTSDGQDLYVEVNKLIDVKLEDNQ